MKENKFKSATMRKFFFRRAAHYFAMFIVPSLIIFMITGFLLIRNASNKISDQSEAALNSISENFEASVNRIVEQQLYITNNTRIKLALKKLMMNEEIDYGSLINLKNLNSILDSTIQSCNYMKSIYIYLDGSERFISSGSAIRNLNTDSDKRWTEYYELMKPEQQICFVKRKIPEYLDTDILTVFQRMLQKKGVMVMNIDSEVLERVFESMLSWDSMQYFIVQDDGVILEKTVHKKNNISEESFADNILQNMELSDGQWLKAEKRYYYVCRKKAGDYPVSIYILTDRSQLRRELYIPLVIAVSILLADCIVVLILSYRITRRNFEHINYMLELFDEAQKGGVPKERQINNADEYDLIMNNILRMFLSTSYLRYRQRAAELSTLQYQINPHFLFNTLQAVNMQIQDSTGDKKLGNVIINLSMILKYSLGNPLETVTLDEEITYIKKYVSIQQYRFGDFIMYYEIQEGLERIPVYRMILQPLIENSILHGIRCSERKGMIKISVVKRAEEIWFYIVDNGCGMDEAELSQLKAAINDENSRNIGATNVNRRLKLIYGDEHELDIHSWKGLGTCMVFHIPPKACDDKK